MKISFSFQRCFLLTFWDPLIWDTGSSNFNSNSIYRYLFYRGRNAWQSTSRNCLGPLFSQNMIQESENSYTKGLASFASKTHYCFPKREFLLSFSLVLLEVKLACNEQCIMMAEGEGWLWLISYMKSTGMLAIKSANNSHGNSSVFHGVNIFEHVPLCHGIFNGPWILQGDI